LFPHVTVATRPSGRPSIVACFSGRFGDGELTHRSQFDSVTTSIAGTDKLEQQRCISPSSNVQCCRATERMVKPASPEEVMNNFFLYLTATYLL